MTHYDVLGVLPSATRGQVRAAFRRRSRALHPDHNPGVAPNHAALAELAEAWRVLGDPGRRAVYDRGRDLGTPPWQPPDEVRAPDLSPRAAARLRLVFVVVIALSTVLMVTFFLIAFTQSG